MTDQQRFEMRCQRAFAQFDRKQKREREAFEAAWAALRRDVYRKPQIGLAVLGTPLGDK